MEGAAGIEAEPFWDYHKGWYDGSIRGMDSEIARLLEHLHSQGLLDDTLIVFFSDHGDGLPRCKRWVYDSGTHIPLIVRFPNGRGAGTSNGV